MANADKTLLNKDNLEIYPITRERNVYDENNVNLKEKFKTVVFKDNEVHKFSQELYEESSNILQIPDIPETTKNGITYSIKDGVITLNGTCTTQFDLFDIYSIKTADSGGIRLFHNQTSFPEYIGFGSWNGSWADYININRDNNANGKVYTSARNHVALTVYKGLVANNLQLMPMITNIPVIPTTFGKYNPNRHITNSEAEFLKNEHDKQSNLLPLENKEYSGSFSNAWDSFTIPLLQNLTLKAGKKYSWSAKIKSSNGCRMNKLGLTTNEETLIDLYNLGTLTNNYITVSKTFTPTTDIVVNYIYVHNATVGSIDVKEINVVEGDLKEYTEYNSSSHITNEQADFLKSEWEKSSNLFKQGKSANYFLGYLESGKKYCISANLTLSSGSTTYTGPVNRYDINTGQTSANNDGVSRAYKTFNTSGLNSYVMTCNVSGYYEIETFNVPNTNVVVKNIMINEGTEPLPHHEWNGKIIHEKDIEQIKVWENATPSSGIGFTADIALNIVNVFDYKFGYLLWYMSTNIGSLAPVITQVELMPNKNNYMRLTSAIDDNGTIATRTLAITVDGKLIIQNCFIGGAEDNQKIIPFKFYVSNY